jgi:hypothetical protein
VSIYVPFRFLIAAAAALLIATVIASSPAHALLLGDAVAQSALGEPLRVVIPIKPARGESLESACFRLVPNGAGAGAPIVTAKVNLERAAATPRLVVTTPTAVREPAVQFTIQAGCDGTTRRNYVLLLDPPALRTTTAIRPITASEPRQERHKTMPSTARRSADNAAPSESRETPRVVARDHASGATAFGTAPGSREAVAATASPAAFHQAAAPDLASESKPTVQRVPSVEGDERANPWWYLAAPLVAIGAITLGTFFVRRRRATPEVPQWTRGAAYTGPRSFTDMSAAPVTLSHAEETPLPSISSGTKPRSVPRSQFTVEVTAPPSLGRQTDPDISTLDTLTNDIAEADMAEERAVREAWAAARSDVEREADGNAILRAIEAAERDLLFAPPAPAQAAMDHSLDDDLLAVPRRPDKAAA